MNLIEPPFKPGTARRLGIHKPCPCMAIPVRWTLSPGAADDYAAAWNNRHLTTQPVTTWIEPIANQPRRICHGECGLSAT